MAQVLYLSRDQPIASIAAYRGAWDQTNNLLTGGLQPQREGCGVLNFVSTAETNVSATWDVLLFRGISAPMAAQTLSGNFDLVVGVQESNLAADFVYHVHVWVTVGDTDTVRGTLINDYIDGVEWPTTAAGRALSAPQAYGPLAVQAGDRIVIEIGYRAQNASTTSRTGTLHYGQLDSVGVITAPLVAGSTSVTTRGGYVTFSNDIAFLSAQASGISILTEEALAAEVFTGLTPTVTPPVGVEADDIIIIGLTHKSGAYATFPGDWTLIARDVEPVSGVRGEVYWKRAAALEALQTYSITGLLNTACGITRIYRGVTRSGNPIDAVVTAVDTTDPLNISGLTTTVPNTVLGFYASQTNIQPFGLVLTDVTADTDIQFEIAARGTGSIAGQVCSGVYLEAFKPMASEVGTLRWLVNPAVANVLILFALVPETTVSNRVATRYYLNRVSPPSVAWRETFPEGTWTRARDNGVDLNLLSGVQTAELAQIKSRGGELVDQNISTDQPGDHILVSRYITPKLEAQTISGTFNICRLIGAVMNDNAHFPIDSYDVRWKVHAYISVGDSPSVRHVLLDNEIDPGAFALFGTTAAWWGWAVPPTMTPGAAVAGDRIVIEIGIVSETLPTIPPNYPPDCWGFVRIGGSGSGQDRSFVAFVDAIMSVTVRVSFNTRQCGYIEFNSVIVEQAVSDPGPSNIDRANAITISSLPYSEPFYSTRNANAPSRQVWYRFVPPATNRYFLTTLGSNYLASIRVYKAPVFTQGTADIVDNRGGLWHGTGGVCDWMCVLDGEAGAEYFIQVLCTGDAHPGGGAVRLGVTPYSAPQDNDLYVPMGVIFAFRNGVIVNADPSFRTNAPAGIAIDFSGDPMYDLNTGAPTNTNPRVYVGMFANNNLVEILDGLTLNVGEPEINYINTATDAAGGGDTGPRNIASLDVVARQLLCGFFGDGFHYINGDHQTNVAAYLDNVSESVWPDAIRECSAYDVDNPVAAAPSTTRYQAAAEKCAAWHIRVHPGNPDLIYYTSGGDYVASVQIDSVVTDLRATQIKVWSRSAGQQADFATVPLAASPHQGLYGIDIHPNGDVLVCNGSRVDRLNSSGAVVQSYTPPVAAKSRAIFAVRYTSAGETFWAFDLDTATLWHFRVSDGAVLQMVDTYGVGAITTQMAIWLSSGITPPVPPEGAAGCPIPTVLPVTGQNACPTPNPTVI